MQQVVDPAGTDPFDVRLLHHSQERLLRPPPGLEQTREVAPISHLGDAQGDLAHPCLPDPLAVAIAVRLPLRRALVPAGSNLLSGFQLQHRLGQLAQAFLQEALIRLQAYIAKVFHQCHTVPVSYRDSWVGHRVLLVWFGDHSRKHTMAFLASRIYTTS